MKHRKQTRKPSITVVVPVFNEVANLDELRTRVVRTLSGIAGEFEIIFVDDGSRDASWLKIERFHHEDPRIKGISLSRNFGHQIALTAGIDHASSDAVVTLDSDLQDPPEVIPALIAKWREGYDVVYGVRIQRHGEGRLMTLIRSFFYRILRRISYIDIPLDAGDFRLMDRKVVEKLKQMRESHRYLRGLTSWIGFKQVGVEYVRDKRMSGTSKYSFGRLLRLALDGIFSFSLSPLRLAGCLGFLLLSVSSLSILFSIAYCLFNRVTSAYLMISTIVLFGTMGVQLICLWMLGEYVGRISDDVKHRLIYIIRNVTDSRRTAAKIKD